MISVDFNTLRVGDELPAMVINVTPTRVVWWQGWTSGSAEPG